MPIETDCEYETGNFTFTFWLQGYFLYWLFGFFVLVFQKKNFHVSNFATIASLSVKSLIFVSIIASFSFENAFQILKQFKDLLQG